MSLEITIKIISRLWARNSARLFAESASATRVLTKFTSAFFSFCAHTNAWVSREINVRRNAAMKQTLATLLVTVLLLVSLVGCGEKKGNNTVTPPPAATDHGTADNSRKSHDTPAVTPPPAPAAAAAISTAPRAIFATGRCSRTAVSTTQTAFCSTARTRITTPCDERAAGAYCSRSFLLY